jgi:hypothetical protein
MGGSRVLAKSRPRPRRPFQPASDAQKRIFLRHLKDGAGVGEARKAAGLTWDLYKHALASDEDFVAAHEDIDGYFLTKLQEVAESMALQRDGAMIRWLLENRWPEKYGKKSKVEHSHVHSIEQIKAMTDEEIEAECESLGVTDTS